MRNFRFSPDVSRTVGGALARNVARKRATYSGFLAAAVGASLTLLAGCTTYAPKPLPTTADLAATPTLAVPAGEFRVPGLVPHSFDPAAALDETTIVMLAVTNNPDLKAARAAAGVAGAQVFEAGLLPDPQLSAGLAKSSAFTGYSLGLAEALGALVSRGARREAAAAHARQVNLDILWQEWQVAQKARELFIQQWADEQQDRLLRPGRDELLRIYRAQAAAMDAGNATAAAVAVSLRTVTDAQASLREAELRLNETRHALNALLGLAPTAAIRLADAPNLAPVSREEFDAAVNALPHRRADLLALQAAYASEEQRVREAVLAQFPAITAGVQQGRSAEEGVRSAGLSVDLQLPLFNRNRGRIAVERATRAQLRREYQARLDQAANDADRIWRATQIMARHGRELEAQLPALRQTVTAAERAYHAAQIDAGTYAGLRANVQSQEVQAITLRADLAKAEAALQTILGMPMKS